MACLLLPLCKPIDNDLAPFEPIAQRGDRHAGVPSVLVALRLFHRKPATSSATMTSCAMIVSRVG